MERGVGVHVAFVRAVMVGRDGLVRSRLIQAFEQAGAADVRSHLTTGNVSFVCEADAVTEITSGARDEIEATVGRTTELYVRSLAELTAMAESQPFARAPLEGPVDRSVSFVGEPVPDIELPIESAAGDVIVFAAGVAELWSVSKIESGIARGPGGLIEAATRRRVTTRAWRTVTRILEWRR